MAGRGGKALAASLVLLAWACAKATDSDLGGGAYDPHAAGKGNASGGSTSRGGTGGSSAASTGGSGAVANAGRGGSSTGGSSTGGSSTGGSSTGGSSTGGQSASGGTGNATASGGTGGSAGQLGQAGDDGVPPDVLAKAKVVLRYAARNQDAMADAVEAHFYFENKADDPLDLAHVTVRYWTTPDGARYGNLQCYYAAIIGSSNVHPVFVDVGTDSHIDITFSAGQVPAHNTNFQQTEVQVKLDAQSGDKFDQTNDYSFDATLTDEQNPQPNGKIAVYLADKLVWGCERSGACAGDEGGAGGQGGEGGQAGHGGEPASSGGSNAGQGQGGQVSAGQGGEPSAAQGGEPSVGQGGA